MGKPAKKSDQPNLLVFDRKQILRRTKDRAMALALQQQIHKFPTFLKPDQIVGFYLYFDPIICSIVSVITEVKIDRRCRVSLYPRSEEILKVGLVRSRKDGFFTEEDLFFQQAYANHPNVSLKLAQLQEGRNEAVKGSRQELKRLDQVMEKAISNLAPGRQI